MLIDPYVVDMLVTENIICEYNGGGHSLRKLKHGDKKEAEREEQRTKYLLELGYKIFTIQSKVDILPSDSDLLNILDNALTYLKDNSIYIYDIDKMQQIIE